MTEEGTKMVMIPLDRMRSLARQAQLASAARQPLEVPPDMVGVLADYLREMLAAAEDQAWFWSDEWQAGEREAEADVAAGRVPVFDSMEDLLADLEQQP
jgi:hypothetical protein